MMMIKDKPKIKQHFPKVLGVSKKLVSFKYIVNTKIKVYLCNKNEVDYWRFHFQFPSQERVLESVTLFFLFNLKVEGEMLGLINCIFINKKNNFLIFKN